MHRIQQNCFRFGRAYVIIVPVMNELPLFPLNTVLFPAMPLTLHVFEERYQQMIARCLVADSTFGVLLIREGSEVGAPAVPFDIGTTAQIVGVERLSEGRMNLVAVGRKRFRLLTVTQQLPYQMGRVAYEPHAIGERAGMMNAAVTVRRLFMEYLRLVATLVDTELRVGELPDDAASLAYVVASALQVDNVVKQQLLTAPSMQAMLQDEADLLPKETKRLYLLAELAKQRKQADAEKIGPFSKN